MNQQALEKWTGPTFPQPLEPGVYLARLISLGMLGHKMRSSPHRVEVVTGIPNERNHHLLVKTGLQHPKYRALGCYEWLTVR